MTSLPWVPTDTSRYHIQSPRCTVGYRLGSKCQSDTRILRKYRAGIPGTVRNLRTCHRRRQSSLRLLDQLRRGPLQRCQHHHHHYSQHRLQRSSRHHRRDVNVRRDVRIFRRLQLYLPKHLLCQRVIQRVSATANRPDGPVGPQH